jgi:hypothetical protein
MSGLVDLGIEALDLIRDHPDGEKARTRTTSLTHTRTSRRVEQECPHGGAQR